MGPKYWRTPADSVKSVMIPGQEFKNLDFLEFAQITVGRALPEISAHSNGPSPLAVGGWRIIFAFSGCVENR